MQQLRIHATDLAQFDHRLVRIVLLDDLLIVLGVLQLDMLVQATLRAIALWAVLDRAFVVARNLGGRPPMPLLLLVINFERHVKYLLVLSLVRLKLVNGGGDTYLESIQLVTEILLLVKQLLEPVGQNDVSVVKPAILLVKVMVIVYYFFVAALAGGLR